MRHETKALMKPKGPNETGWADRYICDGPVRGSCSRQHGAHRHLHTALACLQADRAGCARVGAYSDRTIRHADGSSLTEREREDLERLEDSDGA